ncbi:MAG: glycosyltransferase [Bacteroidota bacterium]
MNQEKSYSLTLDTFEKNFVTISSFKPDGNEWTDVATLIPHFNDLKGLEAAIESTSFSGRLDFIIVDDGSSIKPNLDVLRILTPHKVHLLELRTNQGIEKALNVGLGYIEKNIHCNYVARMDCGDISTSNRLDVQVNFLRSNPEISLVGSWVEFIDEFDKPLYVLRFPEKHVDIIKKLPISVPFMHPSIVFNTHILNKIARYPTQYKAAEDYAFFFSVAQKFKTANIPQVLIRVRLRRSGISLKNRRVQLFSRLRIVLNNWSFEWNYLRGLFRVMALFVLPHSFTESIKRRFWH